MKVMVLGISGLIGSVLFRYLMEYSDYDVYGTVRNRNIVQKHFKKYQNKIISDVELLNSDIVANLFLNIRPDVVINCAGLTKHVANADNSLKAINVNSVLPHRIHLLSEICGSRLIHISTDCVFSGNTGDYKEEDFLDSGDLYGRTKVLGEIISGNTLTIRISTIGHELETAHGLLNWFLMQKDECIGYKNAIFSGFPTVYFSEIMKNYIIPNTELKGLYHISSAPISKFDLLEMIADIYGKKIKITPNYEFKINRSLNSEKFKKATGFNPIGWNEMINKMYNYS